MPLIEAAVDEARFAANAPAPLVFCPPIATFKDDRRAAEDNLACGLCISMEWNPGGDPSRSRIGLSGEPN